jgi:glycerol-3-phosphate acyltransferase PlsY
MNIPLIILFTVAAYLIGASPTALWVGQAYFGIDIREHGSGNAGATNTFRVLGKKPGSFVMAIDIFKGWTATSLVGFLVVFEAIPDNAVVPFQLLFGFLAVIGHIYPVYAGFRGGKGVATLLGMVLAVYPDVAFICLGIFIMVLLISKYVSLSSMIAAVSFPLLMLLPWFRPAHSESLLLGFGAFVALLVIYTHRKNISRIRQGTESRVRFGLGSKRNS